MALLVGLQCSIGLGAMTGPRPASAASAAVEAACGQYEHDECDQSIAATLDPHLVPDDEYGVWEDVSKDTAPSKAIPSELAAAATGTASAEHKSKSNSNKWWYIGGGVAVAGILAFLVPDNPPPAQPLPAYPVHP